MRKITDRIWVGSDQDCFQYREEWVCIHACKSRCHQRAVGYSGNLSPSHPNYLHYLDEDNLYLNLIDPPAPLFKLESFKHFFDFIVPHWDDGKSVLIHCNQGQSRAPSLALLFMSKHSHLISNDSFEDAVREYRELDPLYDPGRGITTFLRACH